MKNRILFTILLCFVFSIIASGCASDKTPAETDDYQLVGGYTDFREPEPDEIALFEMVMNENDDSIVYTPILVKTQVVAGINYLFSATADPQKEGVEAYEVEIIIYQPLTGDPELTEIIKK